MNIENNSIKNKKEIRQFIINNFLFGDDHMFSDNVAFLEKNIIDSTSFLTLVSFLENTFKIKVDDNELLPENLGSIMNISNFIDRKLKNLSPNESGTDNKQYTGYD